MKVLVYSAKPFEMPLLNNANHGVQNLSFTTNRLSLATAAMAEGFEAISIFSADDASAEVLQALSNFGVSYMTLRSVGHDNVATDTAAKLNIRVANVPSYSPNAIAEHAISILLAFNRNIIRAQRQSLQHNFLLDNLIGFDLYQKTVGILGTGKIGSVLARILHGFGCNILAHDLHKDEDLIHSFGVAYVSHRSICEQAKLIFVCLPLTEETKHLINTSYIQQLQKKPILVNIGRGAIVDTVAVLQGLDQELLEGYVTDVYENEHGIFFYDHSHEDIHDKLLHQLLCHPKVLLTPHQGFATQEALTNIAESTISNLNAWSAGARAANEIT
ncbi:MAG: NAD(P)-dependent oxidoreductase [Marinirhabdus sp.]|nr:NAD(P)-dependent oxidoreductase [Marinirhabdus sp.]